VLRDFHSSAQRIFRLWKSPATGVSQSASLLGLFSGLMLVGCLNLVFQLVWS